MQTSIAKGKLMIISLGRRVNTNTKKQEQYLARLKLLILKPDFGKVIKRAIWSKTWRVWTRQ